MQFTRRVLQDAGWGLPASMALHLVLALLFLVRLPDFPSPASEQSVNVELVQPSPPEKKPQQRAPETSEQAAPPPQQPQAFESASAEQEVKSPPEPELPPTAPDKSQKNDEPSEELPHTEKPSETGQIAATEEQKADAPKPAPPAKKLTRAREIYSKDAMAAPRVKQALGKLAPKDRIIQICGIEALDQVRRHQPDAFPDMLAREGGSVSTTGLTVSDGAFRSRHRWYAIDFTCTVDAKTMAIDSFSYNIGSPIPEQEWNRRQLPRD